MPIQRKIIKREKHEREKAFKAYSNSSFTFWKDGDTFFYSDNPSSEKVKLGTLANVNEFLEQFVD